MTSHNNSTSNTTDSTGLSFSPMYSSLSPMASVFHHNGSVQGRHSMHGNFIPNMPGPHASCNTALSGVSSSGIQQPGGNIFGSRFLPNNLSIASQSSHGNPHAHLGFNNIGAPAFNNNLSGVGGSVSGINSNSGVIGNHNSIGSFGVSPMIRNMDSRITGSISNIVGNNMGRNISSGGLSGPGLSSRSNFSVGSSNSFNVQGINRIDAGMMQYAPDILGLFGTSYQNTGGPLSQSQFQGGMRRLNDSGTDDNSPFDMNDFPQLSVQPSSVRGPQGPLVSMRKQGSGVNSVVQQSQEFSIQNEDFPALPGYKGNSSFKEQVRENASITQPQQFSMSRPTAFNLGGTYPSQLEQQKKLQKPQQLEQQKKHAPSFNFNDYPSASNHDTRLNGSDTMQSSQAIYNTHTSGQPVIGSRSMNSASPLSGVGVHNQPSQQYQNSQKHSQHRLQPISLIGPSYKDQTQKSTAGSEYPDHRFTIKNLIDVMKCDPSESLLSLGVDLTLLGLNLNSNTDNLYSTFASPWSEEPLEGNPDYKVPACFNAETPTLKRELFSRFRLDSLFYIFYSAPRDEAQLLAAHELCEKGWFYHKELRMWLTPVANVKPVKTSKDLQRGSYICFDPNKWETIRKDDLVIHYDLIEKPPVV